MPNGGLQNTVLRAVFEKTMAFSFQDFLNILDLGLIIKYGGRGGPTKSV